MEIIGYFENEWVRLTVLIMVLFGGNIIAYLKGFKSLRKNVDKEQNDRLNQISEKLIELDIKIDQNIAFSEKTWDALQVNALNNIDLMRMLNDSLNKVLSGFIPVSKRDKALMVYFDNKLTSVTEAYTYVKNNGLMELVSEVFKSRFLGIGRQSISGFGVDFPEKFVSQLDKINEQCYNDFVNRVQMSVINMSADEHSNAIKIEIDKAFKANIQAIYEAYTHL